MTRQDMPQQGLIYNGKEVRAVGERLNLTDMWKAAGMPPDRRPVDWLASADAKRFVGFLAETLNLGISQDGEMVGNSHLLQIAKGRNGSTQAHWQIGLAYAKYLSPEFHMWCNTVVRERMEGGYNGRAISDALTAKETGGIIKAVIGKALDDRLTPVERAVLKLGETSIGVEKMLVLMGNALEDQDRRINGLLLAADGRVAALEFVSVRELLNEAKALTKGRRRLQGTVGHELRTRALLHRPPIPLRRCPHSGVWLFPRDFANAYMAERGRSLVSAHNDFLKGQGSLLPFPRHRKADRPASPEARP